MGYELSGQALKVMTYNIRFDTPSDGVNAWSKRKEKVLNLITEESPDIIGVQEALYHQVKEIVASNKLFQFSGVGRDDGKYGGEFSAIIFRKDKFDLLEQNTFWLSETPEQPGTKGWDAAYPRVVTWALLIDKQSLRKFLVLNTHFDHVGVEARTKSADLIKEKILALGFEVPVVVMGDFNFTREENAYHLLTDGSVVELIDPASEVKGTYCTFEVKNECKAIDYIFVTNEWNADGYRVIGANDGTYYPSDHLPVTVSLSLTE